MYISSFTSSSRPSLPGWRANLYLRVLREPNQQTNPQQDWEPIQYLGTLKGHLPQWASGQRTQGTDRPWAQRASSQPQALLTGMDGTLDTHTPQPPQDPPFLIPIPPAHSRHLQTGPGFRAGHNPMAQRALASAQGTYHLHTAPRGSHGEGEWETPYPGTVISADGYPLVLGHSKRCWRELASGSRGHRCRRRQGWSGCRGALPIWLRWHLQRQGLGSNHLETFLSKSQAQGKVGDVSS